MRAGADDRNRTYNLLITIQLLCQLSYVGAVIPMQAPIHHIQDLK